MNEGWWEQHAEAFAAWAQNFGPAELRPLDTQALQQLSNLADLRHRGADPLLSPHEGCIGWYWCCAMAAVSKSREEVAALALPGRWRCAASSPTRRWTGR